MLIEEFQAKTDDLQNRVVPEAIKYQEAFGDDWDGQLDYWFLSGDERHKDDTFGGKFSLDNHPMLKLLAAYKVGDIHKQGFYRGVHNWIREKGTTPETKNVTLNWVRDNLIDPDDDKWVKQMANMGAMMHKANTQT